jgi:hypothetical protein
MNKRPTELLPLLIKGTEVDLIEATRQALDDIDEQERSETVRANELRKKLDMIRSAIDRSSDLIGGWLTYEFASICAVFTHPDVISPPQLHVDLPKEIGTIFYTKMNIEEIIRVWDIYQAAPRYHFDKLSTLFQVALTATMTAMMVSLVALAVSGGLNILSAVTLGVTAIAAGVAIDAERRKKALARTITEKFAAARDIISAKLTALPTVVQSIHADMGQRLAAAERRHAERIAEIGASRSALSDSYAESIRRLTAIYDDFYQSLGPLGGDTSDVLCWEQWKPAEDAVNYLRFGHLLAPTAAIDRRLLPPTSLPPLPALLPFADGVGVCLLGGHRTKRQMMDAALSMAVRLIAGIPPGKLRFTFIDPVGLGQNVASLLSLGDHVEELVGSRAWSEQAHIEQRLAELTQHMETIIQKYLRDEYGTIEDYNRHVGHIAEAYHVILIYDFPVNFSESAAKRLVSIAQNGPRCGVYPIVVADIHRQVPYGVSLDELLPHVVQFGSAGDEGIEWNASPSKDWRVTLDGAPPVDLIRHIVNAHGERAERGMHVSVPFKDLMNDAGLEPKLWRDEESSAASLQVPLGPSGARRYQEFLLGRGTAHHALIVGQTGSGKSNLLHVLITMLALKYRPDEIELYLIDFKQGVEFKLYADAGLPHARVIAIQSEREFGLSVLRGLLAEMDRRGDSFREAGVPGLSDWRKKTRAALPRILLLVDEFRVFFTPDDPLASEATMIIDRLVSQGRAFGIHVVLASQTLSGRYSLPQSVSDQMAVRIVLQCTEADSRLALADDNPGARLLSRPGEAIYNDQRGLIEGNHRFQVADMGDDSQREQTLLEYLTPRLATFRSGHRKPIVFEGHKPARIEECDPLAAALQRPSWPEPARFVDVWLGQPIALRPPTTVRFLRQSGANFLLVTRDEAQAAALLQTAMLSIAAQLSPDVVSFHIVDMSSLDTPSAGSFEKVSEALPHRTRIITRRALPQALETLHQQIAHRLDADGYTRESVFLILFGLHRMRDLREDEEAAYVPAEEQKRNPRNLLATLVREGPELGLHVLVWSDNYASLTRCFDRRALDEFGRRVVGPMSEQDSVALIDTALASRLDKPHRLLRIDEDRPGDVEVFRPYADSTGDWLAMEAGRLGQRTTNGRDGQ